MRFQEFLKYFVKLLIVNETILPAYKNHSFRIGTIVGPPAKASHLTNSLVRLTLGIRSAMSFGSAAAFLDTRAAGGPG